MITLTYSCKCGWQSVILDDAQEHSNLTRHKVEIVGSLTPNKAIPTTYVDIEERARARARESAILRIAKEKGLVR